MHAYMEQGPVTRAYTLHIHGSLLWSTSLFFITAGRYGTIAVWCVTSTRSTVAEPVHDAGWKLHQLSGAAWV